MIAELGHFALVLALTLAIAQSVLPLVGAARGDRSFMAIGRQGAIGQLVAMTVAFGALIYAFAVSDFSVSNVAANSHSTKPMIYKISGAWGNHEGSMVMWVWILALYGGAVAVFGRRLPESFQARVLAVQAIIGVGFLAFILATSNPFIRIDPAPIDGNGLNPILQDPGLAFHPPMLYLGYVGFSMAFAFAMAALIEGRVDASWARWVRPWTLAAWVSLSLGIALGSWWAYYELGWGGWWFWDPVENASFMPWLAGTALLHSAIVVEKRDTLKSWTVLLAILTFSLSLLGTFLVRSGVLTSVHAFAVDPARGVFILAMLMATIGASLGLYAWRAPQLKGGGSFAPISREGGLLFNNLLLSTACATVLLGTLYPLFLEGITGEKISVGPPYYELTFVPLMIPMLIMVPVGSLLAWKRGDLRGVMQRLVFALALTLLVVLGGLVWNQGPGALAPFGIALGVWVICGAFAELFSRLQVFTLSAERAWGRVKGLPRSAYGMALAHAGLGVFTIGVVASSAGQQEAITTLRPGQSADVAGYTFTLERVEQHSGPNYNGRRGVVSVRLGDRPVTLLMPEQRFYPAERQQTTEAGIDSGLMRDLYAVIGDPVEDGGFAMRFYHNPLVFWIWGGVGLMGLGGLVSLSDRRHRVGAPTPARKRSAPPAIAQPAT
ncbi:MAG: heme lyase CcmF/NrfE family subunit [Geminicoccaceae bacterium]